MEKLTFPEWGLPMATRPKEEETEVWPGVSAPGVSPVATGAQHHPVADGGIARLAGVHRPQGVRLPKYSGATPLEPYLAQFRIAALHHWLGWGRVRHPACPGVEGGRRCSGRAADHSRELLAGRRRQEGERLGAYAADVLLYAQRGYPAYPAAVREDLALHAFLRGLAPPRLGQHVRLTRPPTLGAALDEAERAEQELSNQPSLQLPGTSRPRVRHCEQDEDGEEPSVPGSGRHPPTDVHPEVTGAVSGAVNRAIWPVTALPRHHGLDPFGRRKTAVEWPSEGTTTPKAFPSPSSVHSGWRPCPRQGPLPPLQARRPTLPGLGGHGVDHLPGASQGSSGHHRRTLGGVDGDQQSPDDRKSDLLCFRSLIALFATNRLFVSLRLASEPGYFPAVAGVCAPDCTYRPHSPVFPSAELLTENQPWIWAQAMLGV
ncbi:hypothetical protein N1851_018510 [Merluccius polli]|uniref:Uncharacterized protein n=1 Tax=Merluccius polli TaxID=89951 RepID=A0AA47MMW7_MERPO|nr:hypothetical protein N1851_018510 [Merluccius polli]